MLNILYWNLGKNAIEDYIVECIAENDIDIAIFSEYVGVELSLIEDKLGGMYKRIRGIQEDEKVSLIIKRNLNAMVIQQQHRYNIYKISTEFKDYLLAATHLQDRRNYKTADRVSTINTMVKDIEMAEEAYRCSNTIVIGDFNANPYDEELTSKYAFNAVLFKSVIEKSEVTNPREMNKKRFYNPILHYISEDTEMYGSFYYENDHMTPYWNCLDQILVRKNLADCVCNIKYVQKIENRCLLKGISPDKKISDHLPLVVNLQEVKNGVR